MSECVKRIFRISFYVLLSVCAIPPTCVCHCLLVVTGGGSNNVEGADRLLPGEISSGLDEVTTAPVLQNSIHPHRTNHDRCYTGVCSSCPHSHVKRWSDPHGLEQLPHPNSYYSLPKNLHSGAGKGPEPSGDVTSQVAV